MKRSFLSALAVCALAGTGTLQAKLVSRAVPYEHAGVRLEGYLAYDDAKAAAGKLPGVLVVPEWWGLNAYAKHRADQLAQLGYVAFAVDMYGKGIVTTSAQEATALSKPFYGSPLMAARGQAGLDQLLGCGLVDPAKVAAIGYCFGGSTVQALAYSGAPLVGIVSFHGGLIPVPKDAAEKNRAKILVYQGEADPLIPRADRTTWKDAMDAGKFNYEFVTFAYAVHAFTNPDADRMAELNGLQGKMGYNAQADHRSWAGMQDFLTEIFGSPGS